MSVLVPYYPHPQKVLVEQTRKKAWDTLLHEARILPPLPPTPPPQVGRPPLIPRVVPAPVKPAPLPQLKAEPKRAAVKPIHVKPMHPPRPAPPPQPIFVPPSPRFQGIGLYVSPSALLLTCSLAPNLTRFPLSWSDVKKNYTRFLLKRIVPGSPPVLDVVDAAFLILAREDRPLTHADIIMLLEKVIHPHPFS